MKTVFSLHCYSCCIWCMLAAYVHVKSISGTHSTKVKAWDRWLLCLGRFRVTGNAGSLCSLQCHEIKSFFYINQLWPQRASVASGIQLQIQQPPEASEKELISRIGMLPVSSFGHILVLPFWLVWRNVRVTYLPCRLATVVKIHVCLSQANGAHQGMGLAGLVGSAFELWLFRASPSVQGLLAGGSHSSPFTKQPLFCYSRLVWKADNIVWMYMCVFGSDTRF